MLTTDIIGPSAPLISNLTCQTHGLIYIQWMRPQLFKNTIDYYYIKYRNRGMKYYDEIELAADKEHLESGVSIFPTTLLCCSNVHLDSNIQ